MLGIRVSDEIFFKIHEDHHAQEIFDLVDSSREYLRAWLPWVDGTKTVDDTLSFIRSSRQGFAQGVTLGGSIWFQEKLVGCADLHMIDRATGRASIGYWLSEGLQGKGIMTQVCQALICYAFEEYRLDKVEIFCATNNRKSRAIPERLGFRHEGTRRHAERLYERVEDHEIYGLLASEYRERNLTP